MQFEGKSFKIVALLAQVPWRCYLAASGMLLSLDALVYDELTDEETWQV